jgi:hypothetical protein
MNTPMPRDAARSSVIFFRRIRTAQRSVLALSRSLCAAGGLALLAACSSEARDAGPSERANGSGAAPDVIAGTSEDYHSAPLHESGSIRGFVRVEGSLPADSTVLPMVDREACAGAFPDSSLVHTGAALGNVVVWLTDVREGKVLPIERRAEMANAHCQLTPRVQAVVAGTTMNVSNEDRLPHVTRFVRAGTSDVVAVVPLTDDGQVVPSEHIAAKAGLIAATCTRHPWTRGYVAVFEHPYFAVTDAAGAFRIDSVPPGKYHLAAWHERGTKRVEQEIEVRAGGEARVEIGVRVK